MEMPLLRWTYQDYKDYLMNKGKSENLSRMLIFQSPYQHGVKHIKTI